MFVFFWNTGFDNACAGCVSNYGFFMSKGFLLHEPNDIAKLQYNLKKTILIYRKKCYSVLTGLLIYPKRDEFSPFYRLSRVFRYQVLKRFKESAPDVNRGCGFLIKFSFLSFRLFSHSSYAGEHLTLDGFEKCAATGRNIRYLVGEAELVDTSYRVAATHE